MEKDIEQMVEDNMKLVYYIFNKLPKTPLREHHKEDLISEGMFGLYKGCKSFDGSKGFKIATYLSRCISNEMYTYIRKVKKNPTDCINLDEQIGEDSDGNILTFADILESKDTVEYFDIDEYVSIYFNHFRSTSNTKHIIPVILRMLSENATQIEMAKYLNISRNNVNRYIAKIRKSILLEKENEQRSGMGCNSRRRHY